MAAKAKESTPRKASSLASARQPATEKDVRVRVFEGHPGTVLRVAMPADGRFALTSSGDGTVRRWELGEGDAKSETVCQARPFIGLTVTADDSLAAAGDRELLSAAEDGYLRRWDVKTGERIVQCKLPFISLYGVAAAGRNDSCAD